MTVYTAEISGRGIVAFEASNEDQAKDRLADTELRRDLHVFQNEGRCLWDGISEIHLRAALPEEVEIWDDSRAMAGRPGQSGNDNWRVFLVTVVDPASDRLDDDDDGPDDDGHD